LSTVDSLRGRIPQFYAVDEAERIIYTKRIPSPTLRNAIRDRSIYDLAKIKQFVKETLITIHTAGVCHCDISIENIFSSGILFDFSHAGFSSSNDWERRKQGDFDKLESTFREAERLHVRLTIPKRPIISSYMI
jgi:tRNA A-37 threonylcarbamoyl transferase component Bud32